MRFAARFGSALCLALCLALLTVPICGCGTMTNPWEGETAPKRVIVTIPALASFVYAVGGDQVAVKCLCLEHGPHEYKADMRDAAMFRQADLFLSVGLTLDDSFADPLYRQARNPKLPHIKVGKKISPELLMELDHDHDHDHGDHHHHHHHGTYDPHLWLGIPEAIAIVEVIAKELSNIDEANASLYEENAKMFVSQLNDLKAYGEKMLEGKKNKRIVSFHESFGYFARGFGLKVAGVIEAAPGDEPTPGHLAKIIKLCKDPNKPVALITVEPQYSAGSAKKVSEALEGKVPLVQVDPLETGSLQEIKTEGGQWYLKRMETNLKAIADKLP
ncbi:MAG: metal ABC transporter substrate-binding protein [Gemmataceae bacterium]